MLASLPLAAIEPNPDQPRKTFEPGALRELADSIAATGLLQPITVRPVGADRFMIVAGERRWRAHCLLAKEGRLEPPVVSCRVVEMDDAAMDIAAIVENLQRADVSPLEESDAFQRLVERGMSAEEIAARVGAPAFRVKWRLSLQGLAPDIRGLLASENLDRQSALEIARLPEHREQHRILGLIRRGQLSGWKAVRNAVDATLSGKDQADMFGGRPSAEECAAVSAIERKIETVARLAQAGFKDGECVILAKVDRDKARLIADQLAAIKKSLNVMERELRNTLGQASALDRAA